jgi:Asp/Glu/hydantoin racemase
LPLLADIDGIVIACYSYHPLVSALKKHTSKPVVGILEASICSALLLLREDEEWGIVSTGKIWESLLRDGVGKFLGIRPGTEGRFRGITTTGLSAIELHEKPAEEVERRMIEATRQLVRKNGNQNENGVGVVCLGCAGMAGMEKMIRAACIQELGLVEGSKIRIVDGVRSGVHMVEGLILSASGAS